MHAVQLLGPGGALYNPRINPLPNADQLSESDAKSWMGQLLVQLTVDDNKVSDSRANVILG